MTDTPERAAWLAGYESGEGAGRLLLRGSIVTLERDRHRDDLLDAAWLNGYGHGVSAAAGPVPGHHLSFVAATGRQELVKN